MSDGITQKRRGRPPGARTKFTGDIRKRFIHVFELLQNQESTSLLTIAKSEPKWFYELSRALFPREVKSDVNVHGTVQHNVQAENRMLQIVGELKQVEAINNKPDLPLPAKTLIKDYFDSIRESITQPSADGKAESV